MPPCGQAFIRPSTVRFAPVMYEDSGLAANATIAHFFRQAFVPPSQVRLAPVM